MENTEQSSFTQIVKNELSYKKRKKCTPADVG